MLVAKLGEQDVVASGKLKLHQPYQCPACHQAVVLKRGAVKAPYFAHCRGSECASSEGETAEHLLGKRQIFDWLKSRGLQPRYEVYFPEIRQRPDILVETHEGLQAIEFQCSPISAKRFAERNAGYRQMKIRFLWLLGGPYRHRLSSAKVGQFAQLIGSQLVVPMWNTRTARLELSDRSRYELTPHCRRATVLRQSGLIQSQVSHGNPNVRDIQLKCYLQGRNVCGLPSIAHYLEKSWPILKCPNTWIQTEIILKLEQFSLGHQWSEVAWYQLLNQIVGPRWIDYPCVENIDERRQQYLHNFTGKLVQAGIIHSGVNGLMYRKPAQWFADGQIKNASLLRRSEL